MISLFNDPNKYGIIPDPPEPPECPETHMVDEICECCSRYKECKAEYERINGDDE